MNTENENFILELGESFKEILKNKDKIINNIRTNIINERLEVMRLFILLRQLIDNMTDLDEFLTEDDILDRLKTIKKEMKDFIISFLLADIDLVIE